VPIVVSTGEHNGPYGNGDLKLVVCGNPNCINPVITTVDRGRLQYTEDVGKHVSMVLDAKGNPVMLYAGTSGGVFGNDGVSWTAINGGLTNTSVSALAIDPGGYWDYGGDNYQKIYNGSHVLIGGC